MASFLDINAAGDRLLINSTDLLLIETSTGTPGRFITGRAPERTFTGSKPKH